MRDMRADRSLGGTAPLPDVGPPQPHRQIVEPNEVQHNAIPLDGQSVRSLKSQAQSGHVTFGDPVANALNDGAANLADAVLLTNDRGLIDKVKDKLGLHKDEDLRDIARGTPLRQDQLDKLDANEKGMLLDATSPQGAQAAIDALKRIDPSG